MREDLATLRHFINSWAHDGDCMIFLPSGTCTCESIADKTRPYAALQSIEEQVEVYERGLRSLAFATGPDGPTWVQSTPELAEAALLASKSNPAIRSECDHVWRDIAGAGFFSCDRCGVAKPSSERSPASGSRDA
jgi:hypothetical protein